MLPSSSQLQQELLAIEVEEAELAVRQQQLEMRKAYAALQIQQLPPASLSSFLSTSLLSPSMLAMMQMSTNAFPSGLHILHSGRNYPVGGIRDQPRQGSDKAVTGWNSSERPPPSNIDPSVGDWQCRNCSSYKLYYIGMLHIESGS